MVTGRGVPDGDDQRCRGSVPGTPRLEAAAADAGAHARGSPHPAGAAATAGAHALGSPHPAGAAAAADAPAPGWPRRAGVPAAADAPAPGWPRRAGAAAAAGAPAPGWPRRAGAAAVAGAPAPVGLVEPVLLQPLALPLAIAVVSLAQLTKTLCVGSPQVCVSCPLLPAPLQRGLELLFRPPLSKATLALGSPSALGSRGPSSARHVRRSSRT